MPSIKSIVSRRRDSEEGFTLIELMVVVLIIAILIAIAIPQFLGARGRAQDSAAKSDLRNGLTAAKTLYTDKQSYLDTDAATTQADLVKIEPSLKWAAGAPAVSESADGQTVCLTETSKSGTVFAVADVATGANAGTFYNKGACSVDPTVVSAAPWTSSW